MRFAIFTHVEHNRREGIYCSYAPYVREMNIWLRHVEEVEVVAPLVDDGETEGCREQEIGYKHAELNFTTVPSFNFLSFSSTVKAFIQIPYIFFKILTAMRRADHLHLRCPGNVGLLACIVQTFFPSKPKSAKYAGNWDPQAKQPWTYRLQKWILSNKFLTRNMQVLIYGEWPGQLDNVKPFFTASFSEREIFKVKEKNFDGCFTFLFVGNLVAGKQPQKAIKMVEELNKIRTGTIQQYLISLGIYGDGVERNKLENYVSDKNLQKMVTFKGNRPLEELIAAYQRAQFVILPSKSEGWPKAIAEGMFYGCVPIATPVSCVPWMLNYGSRGILLDELRTQEPRTKRLDLICGNIDKVELLLQDPQEMRRMSEAAKKWSQQYTLEKFEEAIKEVLQKSSSPSGRACSPWRSGGVG